MTSPIRLDGTIFSISVRSFFTFLSALIFSVGIFLLISALTDVISYNLFDLPMRSDVQVLLNENRSIIGLSIYMIIFTMFFPSKSFRKNASIGKFSFLRYLGYFELLLLFTVPLIFFDPFTIERSALALLFMFIFMLSLYISSRSENSKHNVRLNESIGITSQSAKVYARVASGAFEILSFFPELIMVLALTVLATDWQFLILPMIMILISRYFYGRRRGEIAYTEFTNYVRQVSYILFAYVAILTFMVDRGIYITLPFTLSLQQNNTILFILLLISSSLTVLIIGNLRKIRIPTIRFKRG